MSNVIVSENYLICSRQWSPNLNFLYLENCVSCKVYVSKTWIFSSRLTLEHAYMRILRIPRVSCKREKPHWGQSSCKREKPHWGSIIRGVNQLSKWATNSLNSWRPNSLNRKTLHVTTVHMSETIIQCTIKQLYSVAHLHSTIAGGGHAPHTCIALFRHLTSFVFIMSWSLYA